MSLLAYRHFHEESNIATVLTVVLAELGLTTLDQEARGQELTLHGEIQRGRFLEGRGLILRDALRYLSARGVKLQIFHDASRTSALQQRLLSERPDFDFQLLNDIGSNQTNPLALERDLQRGKSIMLVESRAACGRLPLHVLLVRRHGDRIQVMNSETGKNHSYSIEQVARHLNAPISFGATGFAERLYMYSGLTFHIGC